MHYIALLLGLIFFCGGTVLAQPTPVEIKIDPKNMPEGDLRMSDWIESIEYIPLETTDQCLLDENIIYDYNDNHIIVSYYDAETIYLFDRKGKFIRTIGRRGQGPEEYTNSFSLFIDMNDEYIIVADINKTLYYGIDGKLLYASPSPIDARKPELYFREQFLRVAESNVYRDSTYYVFEIRDIKGNLVKEEIPSCPIPTVADKSLEIAYSSVIIDHVYMYKNTPYVRETMNDTIYMIDGLNHFIPKYVFNLGKYKITPEVQGDVDHFFDRVQKYVVPERIIELPDYLLIQYYHQMRSSYCYWDKHTRKTYSLNIRGGFQNDYDGGPNFEEVNQRNNLFSGFFSAERFLDPKLRSKQMPRGPQSAVRAFEKLVKKVDPDDNPIIMIVKLKE